jgi:hypothetical protein
VRKALQRDEVASLIPFNSSHSLYFLQALVAYFTSILYSFSPTRLKIFTHHILKMLFTTPFLATLFLGVASAAVLPTRQANSQSFTGALGGIAATPILDSGNAGRPFSVKGDTFVNLGAALQRSCDQQFNACANAANGRKAAFSTAQCTAQKSRSYLK